MAIVEKLANFDGLTLQAILSFLRHLKTKETDCVLRRLIAARPVSRGPGIGVGSVSKAITPPTRTKTSDGEINDVESSSMDQVTKSSRQLVGERTICPPDAPPDLLSEVLHDLRLARATYGRSELTAPWGIKIPFKEGVRFHFLAEGSCWMYTDSQPSMFLDTGDVVLLPRGTGHVIADKPTRRARPLEDIGPELIGNAVYRLSAGGGGERTLIVCCTIGFEGPTAHPLIELLPEVMHVRQSDFSDPALPALLTMMADEVLQPQIGSATIMARLADIVMTRIIRAWVETRPSDLTGWLAAVKDPNVGLALARIHRHPGQDWNVESLASIAGMSRSKFSERFSHLLGVSPAKYLSQWRMRLAATWLRNEYMTVAQTAEQFGYESDAAFSRAFKRFWGVPPSASRNTTP